VPRTNRSYLCPARLVGALYESTVHPFHRDLVGLHAKPKRMDEPFFNTRWHIDCIMLFGGRAKRSKKMLDEIFDKNLSSFIIRYRYPSYRRASQRGSVFTLFLL
jgi:hypothetical protein